MRPRDRDGLALPGTDAKRGCHEGKAIQAAPLGTRCLGLRAGSLRLTTLAALQRCESLPRLKGLRDARCLDRWQSEKALPHRGIPWSIFRRGDFLSLIHISEPTRLGMISYAVFCLKKKKKKKKT